MAGIPFTIEYYHTQNDATPYDSDSTVTQNSEIGTNINKYYNINLDSGDTPEYHLLSDDYTSTDIWNDVYADIGQWTGADVVPLYDSIVTAPDPNVINNGDQMIISTVIKNGVEYDISGDLAGKTLIADAITDKGVSTSATDSFATMASNIESIDTNQSLNSSNGAFISEAYYSGYEAEVSSAEFGINDFNGRIGFIKNNNHSSGYTSCLIAITDSNGTVSHAEKNLNITGATVKSYIYNGDETNVYFYCGPSTGDGTLFCMINTTTNSINFNPTAPSGTKEQITTTSTNVSYKIGRRIIDNTTYCHDIILLLQKY